LTDVVIKTLKDMTGIYYAESTTNWQQKILDEVRDVMRLHHYSIHTERSYCDWIRRFALYPYSPAGWTGSAQPCG